MNNPVVVTSVFTPLAGQHDNLVATLQSTIPAVHDEEGCELYAIHDAPDGTIVMIEKRESTALLRKHAAGSAVAALNAAIGSFLSKPVVVTELTPIPVRDSEQSVL